MEVYNNVLELIGNTPIVRMQSVGRGLKPTLLAKLEMFNREEIKIFRDSGFSPIFFGECVFGPRQPSLTYMVAFDSMEAREKCWKTFVSSEAFNRIKKMPGWTDPEAVSNIYGSFVRSTPYSQIT